MDRITLDLRPVRGALAAQLERCDQRPTLKLECIKPAPPRTCPQFGEWLVARRVLSRAQLLRALATSNLHGWRIGDAVVVLRLATRKRVELEARRFEQLHGREEPRRVRLQQRLRRLERELRSARVSTRRTG